MKPFMLVLLLTSFSPAQDTHSWDSLAQLKTGDRVRVSMSTRGPVTGAFQSYTPEQVTVGGVTANKPDVTKVERYGQRGGSRGKHAAIGALIGFGGGFAIGAAITTSCSKNSNQQLGAIGCWLPLPSRGEAGAVVGGAGAVVGAVIGALLPHHNKELIYAS